MTKANQSVTIQFPLILVSFYNNVESIGFLDDKRVLVNIADEKSMENAAKYFTDRGTYTLLAIESQ